MGSFLPLDFGGAISSMTFVFGGTLKGSCSVTSKVLFSKSTLRQRKHKKYLDDVIVHLYARNTPLQGIDFF